MSEIPENILSVLGFAVDLFINQPVLDLPVQSTILAASGLVIVLFAVFSDILKDFSSFGSSMSIMIALCLAALSYMFYLNNEVLVLTLCTFFCLLIRVGEAAVVGRSLASFWGLLALSLAGALLIGAILFQRTTWSLEQSYLLGVWNLGQALLAARLAATIQTDYGTLKSKGLLVAGFFLMIVAASIRLPETFEIKQLYLWSYPSVLILSFIMNWMKRPNRSLKAAR